jgi:hypothetical protein
MGVANIAGSLTFGAMSPSPIGALTGALGLAKRNTAINSWGLQQLGWGLDPDIADMVAEEMSKQETATAIGHAAKSGLFGSLMDTISRAIGEFGDLAGSSNPSVGNFGGYSRGDPGYGDVPGMGGDPSGGGGGRTGTSNDPGGPSTDTPGDPSGMSFASGGLFRTTGRTRMTVGEAGSEEVAVLKNPREVMGGSGVGGGGKVTINLYNSGVIGNQLPDALMREIRRELDRRDARLVKY